MSYTALLERVDGLLERRGILGHIAAERFSDDFKAYLVYLDTLGVGSANRTVDLLEDDANLVPSTRLDSNFATTFEQFIPPQLYTDPVFTELYPKLIENKGKGVGEGELFLPLVIADYEFSNSSDGLLRGSLKVEVKKNGASLKPIKTGITKKGLVDDLNLEYFAGTAPGKKSRRLFERHLAAVRDPQDYAAYFAALYPGLNTTELAATVAECYTDSEQFCTAVGRFALRNYQLTDGWHTIIYLDTAKGKIVNICDTDNCDDLGLRFSPVLARKNDTQAIADGYVNVSI